VTRQIGQMPLPLSRQSRDTTHGEENNTRDSMISEEN